MSRYYRCPRCHEVFQSRLKLVEHFRNLTSCSNDYDSTPRYNLLCDLWREPQKFEIDVKEVLKERIVDLEQEIVRLKTK